MPYADLPARWGVSSERTPAGLWVVVPPVPNWRYLIKSHGWVAIPFGIGLCNVVSVTLMGASARGWELLWPVGFYSTVFVIVFWHAWFRLRTRTVLRVTHDELAIALVAPGGRCRATRWPRAAVTEVKVNPFSGRLLVRAAGHDMAEFFLSPNAEVNEWAAEAVRRDVFEGEFAPTQGAAEAADDPFRATAAGNGHARSALSAVGLCLAATGAILLIVPRLMPIGFGLILVAAVPLGIAMGTQKKEFYT